MTTCAPVEVPLVLDLSTLEPDQHLEVSVTLTLSFEEPEADATADNPEQEGV